MKADLIKFIRERALPEMEKRQAIKAINEIHKYRLAFYNHRAVRLDLAFDWFSTKQGSSYWSRISNAPMCKDIAKLYVPADISTRYRFPLAGRAIFIHRDMV